VTVKPTISRGVLRDSFALIVVAARPREEVLVPYPASLGEEPNATHCRSTLLVASMQTLRRHGHYDRYATFLPPDHLHSVAAAGAGLWLPIERGIVHYRACDQLALPIDEQLVMGGEVVRELQRTFIGTVLRAAGSGVGVTPLAGLEKFASVYSRSIKGGGARVVRLGPKDVRVEFVGLPFAAIRYFRIAYRGFIQAGCEFFARRVVVAELDSYLTATTCAYRIAWV
jgi:hypothetical protein